MPIATKLSNRAVDGLYLSSSGLSITLTAANGANILINSTLAGIIITMPDATTLEAGAVYTIRSLNQQFYVNDFGGSFLISVTDTVTSYTLYLIDNSTTAGSWYGTSSLTYATGLL